MMVMVKRMMTMTMKLMMIVLTNVVSIVVNCGQIL